MKGWNAKEASLRISALGLERADEGTRTPDPLITNQKLYQLSYVGLFM
jgi:hypothetical protein